MSGDPSDSPGEVTQTGIFVRPSRLPADPRQLIPVLRVASGEERLKVVRVQFGMEISIGRDPTVSLTLTHPSVSRRHARVIPEGDGYWVLDDGSTNGTFVNGDRVRSRVPLKVGDRLEVGSVVLRLEPLSEGEVAHLEQVIAHLDTARQDPLTGLLTRRWVQEDLPLLIEKALPTQEALAALMFDIDHFKLVNDTFGHPTGDTVIKTVASLIVGTIRASDFAVRYGGEEFLVILRDSTESGAMALAERIRLRTAAHPWDQEGLGAHRVTVSGGMGSWVPGEAIESWIERTDHALLRAKRGGRNRTLMATFSTVVIEADLRRD